MELPGDAYARLLAFRTGLRQFERWSAEQARAAGLTPAHHQLLLAIRGHGASPTIGEVADYLVLRHHSTVELVDRAEAAGLIRRVRSGSDHRVVHLELTDEGAQRLEALTALHLEELQRLAADVAGIWQGLTPLQRPHGSPGEPEGQDVPVTVGIARIYDEQTPGTRRILVDRLWPRGVAKAEAPFDDWQKELAPSPELRTWYGHEPRRYATFSRRYRKELGKSPAKEALTEVRSTARSARVVLVTATKDVERSGAAVIRDVLAGR